MSDYIKTVIEDGGTMCGNCGDWRLLKPDESGGLRDVTTGLRIIEDCPGCGDEAFDIYETEENVP